MSADFTDPTTGSAAPVGVVLDASIGVMWAVPEDHSDYAARLLDDRFWRIVPDLWLIEVGNALWKRVRRGDFTHERAVELYGLIRAVKVKVVLANELADRAFRIALETGRTVYDSLYLALATELALPFVTADQRLVNGLKGSSYYHQLVWIERVDERFPVQQ